jgi:hypothetical protein
VETLENGIDKKRNSTASVRMEYLF